MGFEFEASEDVKPGGGNYLQEPGTYHFLLKSLKEGVGPKGNAIDGITIEVETLAGTTKDCRGKVHSETFFNVDWSKNEKAQEIAKKRLTRFFIAIDMMDPHDRGKKVSINLDETVETKEGPVPIWFERQFVMRLVRQKEKDENGEYTKESKFLQVDFVAVYHVDDPAVEAIPKNEAALEYIPKDLRHDSSWFEKLADGAHKNTSQQPATTAASSSDFDNL